jgi:hypothetical protein
MPIRGVGEHVNNGMKIPYSPSRGSVGAPGVLALSYEAGLEILAVFMKPDALHNTLSGLIGAPLGKKMIASSKSAGRNDRITAWRTRSRAARSAA